jgi:hypothetical protein
LVAVTKGIPLWVANIWRIEPIPFHFYYLGSKQAALRHNLASATLPVFTKLVHSDKVGGLGLQTFEKQVFWFRKVGDLRLLSHFYISGSYQQNAGVAAGNMDWLLPFHILGKLIGLFKLGCANHQGNARPGLG